MNNPLIVLPPKAVELLVADIKTEWNSKNDIILQQYAYLYKYESSRGILCCAKKLPGCAWNFYLYDKNNHLIFTQDGNQRLRGEWVFTLPDISGRTCLTGICHNTFTFDTYNSPIRHLWIVAQRDASKFGYSIKDNIIELVNPTVLSVNFYDNYSCSTVCNLDNLELAYNSENSFDQRYYTDNAVDMLTGTLTGVLNESGEIYKYLGCMMYYDNRGRLIQMKSTDHLGYGIEKDYFAYNFIGQPLKQKHVHMAADKVTQIELYTYTYDHAGRLLTTTHELNDGGKIKLIDNMYDELGRLKCNKRNGHPDLKTDYTYNVRSWTKSITSPLFTQTLYYNDKRANQSNIASYNGNISAMDWKVATSEEKQRGYDFMYDGLSRLREATYLENGIRNDKFNTSYGYDKHGNIQTLVRYGNTGTTGTGIVDNLTLRYNGNQLVHVDDAGETTTLSMSMDFKQRSNADIQYYYDGNGNLVKDLNKGISDIKYNLLNLPEQIKFTSANNPVNSYVYSAGGKKLSVIHKSTTEKRTDYIGNMIYENGSLKRILVDGGYIENGVYHFYIQDHLGNNRVVAKSDGTVIQTNHYYPYGMSFAEGTFVDKQPYKYNGKELDTENGLNLYDYDARQMDGVLGRFVGVDAHAENYYSWSPYVYVGGNPLKYIDPTGKDWFVNGETGDIHFFRGVTELNKLSNEQIKLAGINKDDLGSYEKLGGDDMIKIGSDIIASSNIGGVASKFMTYHGFVSADRVRVEETTTDYTYTEADGGQRVVSSTTTTQEVNRYKSYVRTHYIERQDNGTILGMTMNPTPGWNEGRYVDSRKLIISPGIQKSIKISDYKIPVGAPYSAPSQKTNVAPETKNNLIRIFLDIFNMTIN